MGIEKATHSESESGLALSEKGQRGREDRRAETYHDIARAD